MSGEMTMLEINRRSRLALDLILVGMIEEIEGHVPSKEEIGMHGVTIQLSQVPDDPHAFTNFFVWRNHHVLGFCVEFEGPLMQEGDGVDLGGGFRLVTERIYPDEQPYALRTFMARQRGGHGFYA